MKQTKLSIRGWEPPSNVRVMEQETMHVRKSCKELGLLREKEAIFRSGEVRGMEMKKGIILVKI